MAGYRKDRVAEDIKREIVALIRELKDPRIHPMTSVVQVSVTTTVSPGVVIFTESCCVNAGIATNSSRTRSNSFIVVLKCAKFTSKFVPIGIICVNLYYDNDIPMAIDSIG
jgi:ribosome-binding factor A